MIDELERLGAPVVSIQAKLTRREYRILYKLLWTAEANVMNEVFQKILMDQKIVYEVKFTEEELRQADDTLSSIIRKFNLQPPNRVSDMKALPHE